jgi:hypothetical protein
MNLLKMTAPNTSAHSYGQFPTQVPIFMDSFQHKCPFLWTASNTSAYFYGQLPTQVPIFMDSFQYKCLFLWTASNTSTHPRNKHLFTENITTSAISAGNTVNGFI